MVAQRSNTLKILTAGAVGAAVFQHCSFVPAPAARQEAAAAAVGAAAAALGAAPAFADEIGDAAVELSNKAYPFMKEVDWLSYLYNVKPGSAGALEWLKAVDSALVMGAEMDSGLLKDAAMAHHKAISTVDGAGVLSKGSLTEVDAAIGRLIASVPESKTMDVYNSFSSLVSPDVPKYLMSTVNEEDAKAAYAALMDFKDVVKAHPITPTEPTFAARTPSTENLDAVAAAASKLSSASYPFIKDVDWTSELFQTPLPGVSATQALKAVDKAILMGANMDPKLLKAAVMAHHQAIGSVDAKGVTSAADYEAVNAALGKLIASVPESQVMDVYNAFAKITSPVLPSYLFSSFSKGADAIAAYKALLEFKNVVKAAQI